MSQPEDMNAGRGESQAGKREATSLSFLPNPAEGVNPLELLGQKLAQREAESRHRAQVEALARALYLRWVEADQDRKTDDEVAVAAMQTAGTFYDVCSKWWAE